MATIIVRLIASISLAGAWWHMFVLGRIIFSTFGCNKIGARGACADLQEAYYEGLRQGGIVLLLIALAYRLITRTRRGSHTADQERFDKFFFVGILASFFAGCLATGITGYMNYGIAAL
ncbi:hypothetical protein H7X87_01230 [Acetobacteraceae bacterium]|nr:hypothetical protein [Candidatus Parcubacteria bacterium]